MWSVANISAGKKARLASAFISILVILVAGFFMRSGKIVAPIVLTEASPKPDPWREAANEVEEDRGEPAGREAEVEVPKELRHYDDRRRFLAIQAAEAEEQRFTLPRDYAGLVSLILGGELVEMEAVGDDHILYGVGEGATEEPFTHFDARTGQDIPLLGSRQEYEAEHLRLTESINRQREDLDDLLSKLRRVGRDRALKKALAARIAETRGAIKETSKQAELLASFYKDPLRLSLLVGERKAIYEFAGHFTDKFYDLDDPFERRQFKARLLRFIRPKARDVILEIARTYRGQFGRHLPITSVIRSRQYQRRLGEVNPNVARNSAPPHTTGLAFDIYNRYMSAAEQNFLMSFIAGIESGGRAEALRERRDHIHVFVFPDSRPPDERLIQKYLGRR
jgi:hypothetical protein